MRKVIFDNAELDCLGSESVLDTLLRHGIAAVHGCRVGHCHSCLSRSTSDHLPKDSQLGLNDALIAQNYFLPCICRPHEDIEVVKVEDARLLKRAMVLTKTWLKPDICQLILELPRDFEYRAGQFVNLRQASGLSRSYSLASVPGLDKHLEFHVRRMPGGRMSNWLCDELQMGNTIELIGPVGDHYYNPGNPQQSLLLIGTGTGLAPMMGIVGEALANKHAGDIYLYHGSHIMQGLYLEAKLRSLAEQHSNFHYVPCVSSNEPDLVLEQDVQKGRADQIAFTRHKALERWQVYLCGNPNMVTTAKRTAYIAGAAVKDIHADPFENAV